MYESCSFHATGEKKGGIRLAITRSTLASTGREREPVSIKTAVCEGFSILWDVVGRRNSCSSCTNRSTTSARPLGWYFHPQIKKKTYLELSEVFVVHGNKLNQVDLVSQKQRDKALDARGP